MSRDKTRLTVRRSGACRVVVSTDVEAEALKRRWESLPVGEKLATLHFEDSPLVRRLCKVWQSLCLSDFTCYMLGIDGQDGRRQEDGMDMFATWFQLEGVVGEDGTLHEAVFFAKRAFVEKIDFFEFLARRLGSAFLDGRPALQRQDWPSLFEVPQNSWSNFMGQILKLVELAILHHVQSETRSAHASLPQESLEDFAHGRSAKRRARKKRADLALLKATSGGVRLVDGASLPVADGKLEDPDLCPVCDGTRLLLSDLCPLCGDELDVADAHASLTKQWSSGWHSEGLSHDAAEWFILECPRAHGDVISSSSFPDDAMPEGFRAVVKNSFLHVLPMLPAHKLLRARSAPALEAKANTFE